ncbi:GIY-YIG nuclease family protein [candidate division KSB1 bacterium]|nr:GIY-YIG nuclease family protein [candidate division KSB1 bacterium]MBL7095743.1 GIY-YIG nuclease family protein [candidate division KSB1 bacterium]
METDNFWVYVLELTNGKRYVGHTNNLERRIQEHKNSRSVYTSKYKIKNVLVHFI